MCAVDNKCQIDGPDVEVLIDATHVADEEAINEQVRVSYTANKGAVKDTGSNAMELYDLKSDIGEKRNLVKQHPEVVEELLNLVRAFQWPATLPDTGIIPRKKKSK